jgi:MFS transporter, AAHS family, 4-hydroxybenzoate transporter
MNKFTVSEFLDNRPLSSFQISTFILCGLVLVLDGFDAQSIGFLAPSIAKSIGTPVSTFGPIFGAALFGLMLSSMISGAVADRVGRKWPVVVCTMMFGIFTVFTARAASFEQLLIVRFLTGLGLGGAMPNVVALTSEYAPRRLMSVFVSMLFCGMPLGAVLGGLVGSVMLPRWGWQSVLYVGGALPLAVALLLIQMLPESVRFLSVTAADPRKIKNILARISRDLANLPADSLSFRDERRKGIPVKYLFTEGRAMGTLLLWVPYFMNLVIIYFIVSWLPALLQQAKMPVSAGIRAILLFGLGGVIGSLAQGWLMDRLGALVFLIGEFLVSTIFIGSLAFAASLPLILAVTFILGFTIQGAQAGLNALVASFYPTAIRSTGVGWALGIGRVGSIVGPVLGGVMLSAGWRPRQIFLTGAIPALCAVVALIATSRWRPGASADGSEVDSRVVV